MFRSTLSLSLLVALAAMASAQHTVVHTDKFAPDDMEPFNGAACGYDSGVVVDTNFGRILTGSDALRGLCMMVAGDGCTVRSKSLGGFLAKLSTGFGGNSEMRIVIDEPARSFGGFFNQDYPEGSLEVTLLDQDGQVILQEQTDARTSCGWQWQGWRTNGAARIGEVVIRLEGPASLGLENLHVKYDAPGTDYCYPPVLNSAGMMGTLQFEGSERIGNGPLEFRTSGLPRGEAGMLLVGRAFDFGTTPFGSQALVCVGGVVGSVPLNRFDAEPDGSRCLRPTANILPSQPLETALLPGETWYFQVWYRDANPHTTSNATNAVFVTFE